MPNIISLVTDKQLDPYTNRQLGMLILVCEADDPPSNKEIKDKLFLSGPVVSRALDVLEADGLVIREWSRTDRRTTFLTPTTQGRALYARLCAAA